MTKIRVTYLNNEEKDSIINSLKSNFKILNISKEYISKGKSLYKKVYIDLTK